MTEEEYKSLLRKTNREARQVVKWLDQAIDLVKLWEKEPERIPLELARHKDQLLMAYSRYRILETKIDLLIKLVERLMTQQQSAKDAFNMGWEARMVELLSPLNGEEYDAVRRAVHSAILANDDTIPF